MKNFSIVNRDWSKSWFICNLRVEFCLQLQVKISFAQPR